MHQAKIAYLFTSQPLSEASSARLGSEMMDRLPADISIPDHCRVTPLQIASGASKADLERVLGRKAQSEVGCAKSFCVVTDASLPEGFFLGF